MFEGWSGHRPMVTESPLVRCAVLGLIVLLAGCAGAGDSRYSSACASRQDVVERLKQGYSETPVAIGLSTEGTVVEIFASPAGSFTILLTNPKGVSCVMVAGESWEGFRGFASGQGI